ncbi:MAG: Na/Pi symporter, partial [Treponema sp.]|nr:Na/Pi symporter [Treponema sp.]
MIALLLNMIGGICMLLFGMKMMSEGLQKSAGERMRKTLDFMTGNRFIGVFTGFTLTAIVQSSTAVSVMIVSFVNAGLLSLTQSIGVLFGINIGTTLTAWIVSIVGFRISISSLALPAIGIGFMLGVIKWKYRSAGEFLLGFGFLFLGLHFLTTQMRAANVNEIFDFYAIAGTFGGSRFLAVLIGAGVGLVITVIINSSTGSVAIIMALAFEGVITFEMAAGMIMGAQI